MRRMRQFDAALVGGPTHRDYLVRLGMPAGQHRPGIQRSRQRLFTAGAQSWRDSPTGRSGLPGAPYFLTVCRFAAEKNLVRLDPGVSRVIVSNATRFPPGTLSSVATAAGRARLTTRSLVAAARRRFIARAFSRPTRLSRCYGTPRHLCYRVFPNPGAWSSTRPRRMRPAAPGIVAAPAVRPRSCQSRKGQPAANSIPSISRRSRQTGVDGGPTARRPPGHGPARGPGRFGLGTRPFRTGSHGSHRTRRTQQAAARSYHIARDVKEIKR